MYRQTQLCLTVYIYIILFMMSMHNGMEPIKLTIMFFCNTKKVPY
jgi:hypothetical protein